jgi:hypothetical protein
MNERLANARGLKRRKSADRSAEPLTVLHLAIGCLGVFYESQLVYLRHRLDAAGPADGGESFVTALEGVHALAVELLSHFAAGEPLEPRFPALLAANGQAIDGLAVEGRDLLRRLGSQEPRP